MGDRRKGRDRRKEDRRRRESPVPIPSGRDSGVEAFGWMILAHPLFLDQIERLVEAAEAEGGEEGPNTKLLAHLLDLAFDKIPRDPGNSAFRHGGTLGGDKKNWFRAKTGNGRYRLFFRFHSPSKIIVLAWVNDADSLRTYGSKSDAYAVFASMLDSGNPPSDWEKLVKASSGTGKRLERVDQRPRPKRK